MEPVEFRDDTGFRLPFKASRFTVVPGGCTPPDTHAVAECWFVVSGDAHLVYDNQEISLRHGDIFTFAPHKTHQAFNDGDRDLVVFSTWWDVDGRP
ncbi:MAG TPA: cupin domain-containing protein [Amycolatopsis sp.]|nr:cupin domain-containing protein [Amycolatopsis sp.]